MSSAAELSGPGLMADLDAGGVVMIRGTSSFGFNLIPAGPPQLLLETGVTPLPRALPAGLLLVLLFGRHARRTLGP